MNAEIRFYESDDEQRHLHSDGMRTVEKIFDSETLHISRAKSKKLLEKNDIFPNEVSESVHKEEFRDGICFFIVSSSPLTTRTITTVTTAFTTTTVHPIISDNNCIGDMQEKALYQMSQRKIPQHTYRVLGDEKHYTHLRLGTTNDPSVSSGVASIDSSELSLDLLNMERNGNYIGLKDLHPIIIEDFNIDHMCSASPLVGKNVQVVVSEQDFDCNFLPCYTHEKQNKVECKSISTQTMHSISCPCPCGKENNKVRSPRRYRSSLNSSSDSSRRDSGFSSQSATSPPHHDNNSSELNNENLSYNSSCNNDDPADAILRDKGHKLNYHSDKEKEYLLRQIKGRLFDPQKELLMIELKNLLEKSKLNAFTEDNFNVKTWKPIFQKKSTYPKGVLKNGFFEPPKLCSKKSKRAPERSRRNNKLHFKKSETIETILQVRKCLDIIGNVTSLKNNVQRHKKIKLKSYKVQQKNNKQTRCQQTRCQQKNLLTDTNDLDDTDTNDIDNIVATSNVQNIDDIFCSQQSKKNSRCFPVFKPAQKPSHKIISASTISKQQNEAPNAVVAKTKQLDVKSKPSLLHSAAQKGNIKDILKLMESSEFDVNEKDSNDWPAMHHAIQNKHYRTAILLLESGTDVKEYTQQRINEYRETVKIINRNK